MKTSNNTDTDVDIPRIPLRYLRYFSGILTYNPSPTPIPLTVHVRSTNCPLRASGPRRRFSVDSIKLNRAAYRPNYAPILFPSPPPFRSFSRRGEMLEMLVSRTSEF